MFGVDVGTGSVKAALLTESGRQVGLASCGYPLITNSEGWVEADAEGIWRALVQCAAEVLRSGCDPSRIAGIGISCLCPGLTALDAQGHVLQNPILYSDRRSIEEAAWIRETVGEERLLAITANHCMSGAMSGTSMLWIKRHHPEIYDKTRFFGHINTMLAARMTGRFAMDYSNASYTSLFETTGGLRWSHELCAAIGIDPAKLPPLLPSDRSVGKLLAPELLTLGIPAETPVVIGGGDTACASLATGILADGDVCESVGTTNVLTVCVDRPNFDPSFINRCHVVPGKWIYQGAMSYTGASMVWFLDTFCADLRAEAAQKQVSCYDLMDELSERSGPGAGGIVFLPYMMGERSPVWDPNARGIFFGMSLMSARGDFIRAIQEAGGYGERQLMAFAERATGRRIRSFVSMGGGAKSRVLSQLKADITGADIDVLDVKDMAPVGAALLAGIGSGIFQDAQDAAARIEKTVWARVRATAHGRDIYRRHYDIYRQLYPRTKDLFSLN